MANIGYIRISTTEQDTSRQLEKVLLDKVFEEKIASSVTNRPILAKCLESLCKGDTLHVHSIDRLARNLINLETIIQSLADKGVTVHFHTENMIFTNSSADTPNTVQELLFQTLGAFAQLERSLTKERQLEGIKKAQSQGRHLGRPCKISAQDKKNILEKLKTGTSPTGIANEYNVDVSTIYKISG